MILVCDDDTAVLASLSLVLRRAGYEVKTAETPEQIIATVREACPDLILLDMNYSRQTDGEEGLELLAKIKIFCPETPVILMTAWGSINLAVRGVRAGAFDFMTKPWNNIALLNVVETALNLNKDEEEDEAGKMDFIRDKIIGKSPQLMRVLETASRIAHTNASVLITGESGTGKELIAEAIHVNSNRHKGPFVKVNIGGISQSLFESEMFGHKKGAFTDAHFDRIGRFEMAAKGTIFLDEMGELDQVCQVKLLRVLQDRTFESLGDSKQKQTDTRVISATNRNLAKMVADGTFREDLFYRINLITIHVPALRERPEDVPLLAEYFAGQQTVVNRLPAVHFSSDALEYLKKLPYPGNIRELKNLIDRTILVSGKEVITENDLKAQQADVPQSWRAPAGMLDQMEKEAIEKAIAIYGDNHSRIAVSLGISRQALYRRLEKYGLTLPK